MPLPDQSSEICDDGVGCTLDVPACSKRAVNTTPLPPFPDDGSPCTAFLCDPVYVGDFELQVGCCGNGLVEGGNSATR